MSWGLLGSISTSVRQFSVCQYIHFPLVYNSYTSFSPSLLVASFLDWMPKNVCYASCCWLVLFFIVFSLCLKLLLPQLWLLLLLCLLCPPVYHLSSQLCPWSPPWWGFHWHQVSMMWFCHHCWHQGALEVLLALPLCCSSNLFRLMLIMPWVLHS